MNISFKEFLRNTGLDDNNFQATMHMAGLLHTPTYPSGRGATKSLGWKEIKGKKYCATLVSEDPVVYEGGIPQPPLNTKWRIEIDG